MSWPPNSPDLNPMGNIWDVMERQLRAQTPPMSEYLDCTKNLWHLCPATRGLFWDGPRNCEPRSDDEDDTWAGTPLQTSTAHQRENI
ncbi:hypothetical protein AVEN_65241-1 [Araneus ventricosus]|uniref:Tc1-like transposase DDE domain-containing protein n=1 Tax=Araneus ventricosus TaxID=182803 RepID=A0A4Y2AHA9_ARAVE|nr:hypothetical protein AVEN_65241-1 [Araneus ventricosus]